ncbi:hypothetical protein MTsDn5_08610 [Alteromonas gracilis]|uniref:hypothetical protein n=1 Tax=Alteromonas gracilis TaxID=1479524 RepID=UPI0036F377C2
MGFLDDVFDFAFGWLMPDPPKQLAPGAELTSAETDASIAKVYGKVQKKNGHIVFKETNDNDDDDYPNDLLHIIVVWGEAVESIDEVYIDDIPNSSNDDAFYSGDKRAVYVRNFKNGMGNYYDPLLAKAGWRDTDKLEGKACSYIRLEYHDDETAITSEPNLTADLTGTTFTNPATALLDYLTNPIYGKGLPASYINYNSFAYAEALCNSDVEEQKDSGEFRDLFSCNISLDTGATVLENVNTLLKPMRGWLPIINGQLTLIVEEDSTPVDLPIIEEDILQMGKITEGNKNNRFNRVSVTYYDPAADGSKQEAVYPEPESEVFDQLLAEDNGFLREESVDLKTCRNYYEALEFAKTYLEVSRQQLRTKITLPKWATVYDVGDIVPVTYMSGLPFWDGKLFRIESKEENREEVILSVREHQPYIYDFFGEGNKPELPDTTYTSKNPDAPTDLNIEHVYSNFVQVRVSWVSEAQRFDYRVLKGDVVVQTERVATHEVELTGFDLGAYRFQVRALSGLGKRSGWAEIPLVMQEPSTPTSIEVIADDLDLEVIPYLSGSDSSTAFLFSISYDLTDEEPPLPHRGPAHTYTFTGLAPNTEYKIWVCSHNPLGNSEWTSVLATTTSTSTRWEDIVKSVQLPGLPDNLGETISGLYKTATDLSNGLDGAFDLIREQESLNIENAITVKKVYGAIANEVESRVLLAETVESNFRDMSTNYLRTVDLFTDAGAARASELNTLKATVENIDVEASISEFKNNQIGYEDENGDWIEGAAFAQAFQEIKINNVDGDQLSVFSYFEALENAIGELEGEIQFAIDANGRMTGVFIRGSQDVSEIIFLATNTYWVDSEGYVVLGVNSATNELEFFGSGRFWGKLVSPEFQMIGANFMKVELADGFGPDSLWYWYGPKILDNDGEPKLSDLTKLNAIEWKDTAGNAYFGGSLSAGTFKNAARSTTLNLNPEVEVGPFGTVGGTKIIVYSIMWSGNSIEDGQCSNVDFDADCTITIQRKIGGGAWTTLQVSHAVAEVTRTYWDEFDHCNTRERMNSAFTITDTNTSQENFSYRAVVSNQQRWHQQQFIDMQQLSLVITEE